MTQVIGWISVTFLVTTIGSQVFKQWKDGTSEGVSYWLFAGEMISNALLLTYSSLVKNYVFMTANAALLLTSMFGLYLKWQHSKDKK